VWTLLGLLTAARRTIVLEQDITQLQHLQVDFDELWVGQGAAVLRVAGDIDLATVDQFREALAALVDRHLKDIVIDATGVTFMDSTGLHALVEGKRLIHERGTNIVLVASSPVRRILELIFPEPLFAARVATMKEALAILSEHE
jgi:anti-sigma B factor antagonist